MGLLFAPFLFIGAVLYVAYPLLRENGQDWMPEDGQNERDRALEEKDQVIEELRDIDMDFRMGKLSSEDYEMLKGNFEKRAGEAFRKLESLPKKSRKHKKQRKF